MKLGMFATQDQTKPSPSSDDPDLTFAQEIAEKNKQIKQEHLRILKQAIEDKPQSPPSSSKPDKPTEKDS